MHPTVKEFCRRARNRYNFPVDVHQFDDGTKTAADAAEAVNSELAQIIKSIVMHVDGEMILVLTSGTHRVDEGALAAELNSDINAIRTANADEVKAATGWSIGGVPPFCHDTDLLTLGDPTFKSYDELWAAAGTPDTMFPIATDKLYEYADPRFVDIYE